MGTYVTRTPYESNRKTFTLSTWAKLANFDGSGASTAYLFTSGNSGSEFFSISFANSNTITISARASNTSQLDIATNALYLDPSAWYHFVIAVDTTQNSVSNRVKIYVNGEQVTSFAANTYPGLNTDLLNLSEVQKIGASQSNSQNFRGSMSHLHWIDGNQYDASYFGETDSTTGQWKIKTSPSVTYGSNGFFIFKDNGSKIDQSGNGNNLSEEGTPGIVSNTQDCPSNVFATLNPLDNYYAQNTFSYGNTRQTSASSPYGWATSTLGMTSGKYYCEVRHSGNTGSNYPEIGIAAKSLGDTSTYLGSIHNTVSYQYNGEILINGTASSFGSAYSSTAIIGIALDVTNSKIYFSLNGVYQGGGNPTTGANGRTITAASATSIGAYFFAGGDYGTSSTITLDWNFGNGVFNTTAVSSAGTNASGNGIFEYDVPTGFTALSTKGLNL